MCHSDAMKTRTFHIDSYIARDEAFHFARKALDQRRPPFLHRHDYYEVFLVERGSTQHLINGRTEQLGKGAIVFIRPDDAHAFRAEKGTGCQIINVMFRAETADHLQNRYGAEIGPRFFWRDGPMPDIYHLSGPRIERAVNSSLELQQSRRSLARIEQFLLYFMTRVVDYVASLPADTPRWLVAACQASRSPEVFRNGAAGFVEAAGRGHEHVCRIARRHLGLSPSAYVNRIRMEYAAMHLGSSDTPVADIAADCGIENLSHFYKLFREHYGNTPRQYRVLHRVNPVQP